MDAQPDDAPLVDPNRLAAWLGGPVDVERHQAGHSNETFFVRYHGAEYVLRRPPRGAFLPTAHDVLRGHRVLAALAPTGVRAPKPYCACEDESVIGAPFYLMERVPGFVVRDRFPRELAPHAQRMGDELIDALAELHNLEWRGTALEQLGKADGYLARQVKRWTGQMDMTLPWTEEKRPVPELREVGAWLAANAPESPRTTVVHGDYKPDNVVFAPDGSLRAILDWEMSTLGDPLADLGWLLSFWKNESSIQRDVTLAPGFADREALIARYEKATGTPARNLAYYEALAVWKLAILLEGSYARHLLGATDDPFFAKMETGVPELARRAWGITRRAS